MTMGVLPGNALIHISPEVDRGAVDSEFVPTFQFALDTGYPANWSALEPNGCVPCSMRLLRLSRNSCPGTLRER
jgi:hypothetical protein